MPASRSVVSVLRPGDNTPATQDRPHPAVTG